MTQSQREILRLTPNREAIRQIRKKKVYRLNYRGKPIIRPINTVDPERNDYKVLWAAYQRGGFSALGNEVTKEEFKILIDHMVNNCHSVLILEDNSSIAAGRHAPVAMIHEKFDGWVMEPHVDWFPWATPRNKLRCIVNYLRHARQVPEFGICLVQCLEPDVKFFKKVSEYGVLFPMSRFSKEDNLLTPAGRIVQGHPDGDLYIFSMLCSRGYTCQAS